MTQSLATIRNLIGACALLMSIAPVWGDQQEEQRFHSGLESINVTATVTDSLGYTSTSAKDGRGTQCGSKYAGGMCARDGDTLRRE